jgi:hypothetical protein
MPSACIQLLKMRPSLLAPYPMAIRCALSRCVMQQENHTIAAEFGVTFKHAITMLRPHAKGG